MASTWAQKAPGVTLSASGPSTPTTGQSRKRDRGPMSQRAARSTRARIPLVRAVSSHSANSSRRQGRWRQPVHASVNERTRDW